MKCNGVFEGGGVRAIALVGALKASEKKGIRFEQVAGTSSGALIASFLAAGYTADEMKQLMIETPFIQFTKKTMIHRVAFGPFLRLLIKKGLYSGQELEAWVRAKLLQKGIRTFADLKPNQLRIIASDITNGRLLVLPHDIEQFGIDPSKLEVARAVRMSTSIPYFFDPVMIRNPVDWKHKANFKKSKKEAKTFATKFTYVVDGAILSNFPLWLFDQGRLQFRKHIPTIGFQLVGRHEGMGHVIKGPLSMFQALFSTMMSAHDERYIERHNRFRTIKIPTLNIGVTQFDLSEKDSFKLYDAGYNAAEHYFKQWSYTKYVNHYEKYVNNVYKLDDAHQQMML